MQNDANPLKMTMNPQVKIYHAMADWCFAIEIHCLLTPIN